MQGFFSLVVHIEIFFPHLHLHSPTCLYGFYYCICIYMTVRGSTLYCTVYSIIQPTTPDGHVACSEETKFLQLSHLRAGRMTVRGCMLYIV
jgi:hypothetical protein